MVTNQAARHQQCPVHSQRKVEVTTDLTDFCLGTPVEPHKHARIPIHMIPANVMDLHKLHDLVHNGHVHVEICKGRVRTPSTSWQTCQ
jgi:hypothetical protein